MRPMCPLSTLLPRLPAAIVDQFAHSIEIARRDVSAREELAHHRGGIPRKHRIDKRPEHRAPHRRLCYRRPVDERASHRAMAYDASLLESRENRGDRSDRKVAPPAQCRVNVSGGGFLLLPEDAKNFELKLAELGSFAHGF